MAHARKKIYLPGSPGYQRQTVQTTLTALQRVAKAKPYDPKNGCFITLKFYHRVGDIGTSKRI